MIYAMVLLNRVIDIIKSETAPSWPPDPQENPVITVECDNNVKLGMIYDPQNGTFSKYIPPVYVPTTAERTEEKVKSIEAAQLTIMEAMAEQYEQSIEKDLNNAEVQATIYEAILALSEGGETV